MGAEMRRISFTDIDGEKVTQEWWFQLGKTDALKMPMSHEFAKEADPESAFRAVVNGDDTQRMLDIWQQMLFTGVGKREGKLIKKSQEIRDEFEFGGAYEAFFNELLETEDAGASFFAKIMPGEDSEGPKAVPVEQYTRDQLLAMTDEEFVKAAGTSNPMDMDKKFFQVAWQRKNQAA